jgi:hypothetical protein
MYRETQKIKNRELALKGISLSPKKGFMKFLTCDLYELLLDVEHLDDVWFVTT